MPQATEIIQDEGRGRGELGTGNGERGGGTGSASLFLYPPHDPFSPFIRDIFHAEKVNAVVLENRPRFIDFRNEI